MQVLVLIFLDFNGIVRALKIIIGSQEGWASVREQVLIAYFRRLEPQRVIFAKHGLSSLRTTRLNCSLLAGGNMQIKMPFGNLSEYRAVTVCTQRFSRMLLWCLDQTKCQLIQLPVQVHSLYLSLVLCFCRVDLQDVCTLNRTGVSCSLASWSGTVGQLRGIEIGPLRAWRVCWDARQCYQRGCNFHHWLFIFTGMQIWQMLRLISWCCSSVGSFSLAVMVWGNRCLGS